MARLVSIICICTFLVCLTPPCAAVLNDHLIATCTPVLSEDQVDSLAPLVGIHNLVFEMHSKQSLAMLDFVNRGKKPVKSILLLTEFYNKDHLPALTLAINMATDSNADLGGKLLTKIQGIQLNVWPKDPLEGGESRRIYGDSPKVVKNCPAEAQITFVQVEYYGEAPRTIMSRPNWRVDAFPISTPILSHEKFRNYNFYTTAAVEINRYGHVRLLEATNLDTKTRALMEDVVSGWSFSPAVDSGTLIDTQETVFVNVGDCAEISTPASRPDADGWIPVDMCTSRDGKNEEVYLGGVLY